MPSKPPAQPSYQALAKAILKLREERGLTQLLLAKGAGIHVTYLSGLENGHRNPSWKVLSQINQALGIRMAELVRLAEQLGNHPGLEPNSATMNKVPSSNAVIEWWLRDSGDDQEENETLNVSTDDARSLIEARLSEISDEAQRIERALVHLKPGQPRGRGGRPKAQKAAVAKPTARRSPGKRAKRGQRQEELLAAIKKMPGASAAELADRIGINSTQAHGLIRKAEAGKLVKKKGQGFEVATKAA